MLMMAALATANVFAVVESQQSRVSVKLATRYPCRNDVLRLAPATRVTLDRLLSANLESISTPDSP